MVIKLQDRNSHILKALIEEYTRTGEPVASEILNVRYRLGVSSATIRNDFVLLTRQGYLYKPYISSGRVPTDKAWKFFIENFFEDEDDFLSEWTGKFRSHVAKVKARTRRNAELAKEIKRLLDFMSEESQSLCFCYLLEEDEIIKQGLKYMFAEMVEEEVLSFRFFRQLAESLERMDEKLRKMQVKENPLVLIGKENPFVRSDEFSSLLANMPRPKAILGILGPKRMPYERNIAILRAITRLAS